MYNRGTFIQGDWIGIEGYFITEVSSFQGDWIGMREGTVYNRGVFISGGLDWTEGITEVSSFQGDWIGMREEAMYNRRVFISGVRGILISGAWLGWNRAV